MTQIVNKEYMLRYHPYCMNIIILKFPFIYFRIHWLRQVGLLAAWRYKYFARSNRCSDPLGQRKETNRIKAMKLGQFIGVFTLFGAGIAISCLTFLCELIFYPYNLNFKN